MSTANSEVGEVAETSADWASLIQDEDHEMDEIDMKPSVRMNSYESLKRALDVALASVMLVLSSPIVVLCLLAVRLSSRGPWIYVQKRLGLGGKVFTIYKIRTMYHHSEQGSGAIWSRPGDPRVTRVGRLLRWSHIDELPQLVNVLRGEMSLVGPRPERPEFLEQLERALPAYRQRLTVRPGLTGLAQVQQAPDTDLSSVRRKLNYDLCYVENMGFWLDTRLMIGTVLKCLGAPFSVIGRILQLPDPNAQPACETLLANPG
jgi:lipopolysaccharide/colanic/teichoic acid biosynthesis glycosyltransferase